MIHLVSLLCTYVAISDVYTNYFKVGEGLTKIWKRESAKKRTDVCIFFSFKLWPKLMSCFATTLTKVLVQRKQMDD